ncbi:MAG: UDP-N-acetylmuramoyl-tripeptide--D-alanyl-D-alanine ligase, partial [Candidatus Omnitrophica bacterium]|nr:UDP-N-acetylmuramoyl-tripeptide--D-alanyl-D-alanine ligase [Candidatus Omnitrophota bacterium]
QFKIPVIAVTGSSGKTTTKEMIASVLSKKYRVLKNEGTKNNQIGLPLTLLKINRHYDIVVVELGTNHPGEIDYLSQIALPNIGIITNIGPAHLEYFKDLNGVYCEKCSLMKNLKSPFLGVLNADDNLLRRKLLRPTKRPVFFSFGIKKPCDWQAMDIHYTKKGIKFSLVQNRKLKFTLKTLGYFNVYNALAAIGIARMIGLEYNDIWAGLANFDFPEGRLKLKKVKGITFIDDTYNSNPLSLSYALEVLAGFKNKGRKIFCMADMLELGRYKEAFHYTAGRKAARVCDIFITVGKLAGISARAAKEANYNCQNIYPCDSTKEAARVLFKKIVPSSDDVILVKGSRAMHMEEIF